MTATSEVEGQQSTDVLIVGAGQAGSQVAMSLRLLGYQGRILIVGDEPYLPYHRPPLSKAFLAGDDEPDSLAFRGSSAYERNAIELRLGVEVAAIDPIRRSAQLADGGSITFDWVVLALGGTPREIQVPVTDAMSGSLVQGTRTEGVHYLRGAEDAMRLRASLRPGRRVAIAGGGFIGLESAAAAIAAGAHATVIELSSRLLERVAHPVISEFFRSAHAQRGVDVVTGTGVGALTSVDGEMRSILLTDGQTLDADLLVVGVGLVANTSLASAMGLELHRGIVVDESGRTGIERVLAVGDCATVRLPTGDFARLESVHNAIEQAKTAAAVIADAPLPIKRAPWFWSDQFDMKLQIAGETGADTAIELDGDLESEKFVALHRLNGRVVGVTTVNEPGRFMKWRGALDKGEDSISQPGAP